jgi:crotonobetaine/carnitine-CoA ligase
MLGYWNQPEATAQVIRDGWMHTGDLVFRDELGYYHMVGRLKDMIRRSGENISAAEVEAILCEHPAVRAAAVVPKPDESRGEEVKAFVQLQPAMRVEPQELVRFVRDRVAAFKAPRYLSFVDAFPLTPSERVAKHELVRDARFGGVPEFDAVTEEWR